MDAVIAYASDRFTRNPGHGLILRGELMEAGVDLHFVTRGKTEHTAEGQMFSGIEDTFSKYFRDKVMEATARGLRGKVEAGIVPGSGHASYGYMFEGKRRETRLVINPEQAEVVRLMFRWYGEEGLTCAEVARKLTDLGVPTPGSSGHGGKRTGPTKWTDGCVVKLLRHEVYSGVWHAYKYRNKANGNHVLRPREEWVPIAVPAIIDRALWQRVQEKIDLGRRQYILPPRYEYLLSRRVKCGACGHHATARSNTIRGRGRLYYACNTAEKTARADCSAPRFRAEQVDGLVWDWVVRLLNDPQSLADGYRDSQRKLQTENEITHQQLDLINGQIAKQQQKLANLLDLFLDGEYGRAVLDEKRRTIEQALTALAEERAQLQERLSEVCITDEQIRSVEAFAADVRSELAAADFALKRRLVEALNLHATLVPDDEGQKVVLLHWYAMDERLCTSSGAPTGSAPRWGQDSAAW